MPDPYILFMSGVWSCTRCGASGDGEGDGHACPRPDQLRARVAKAVARFCFNADCQDEGCYDCTIVQSVVALVRSELRAQRAGARAAPVAGGEQVDGALEFLAEVADSMGHGNAASAETGEVMLSSLAVIRKALAPAQPTEPDGPPSQLDDDGVEQRSTR